jgi:hypothetical protein
LANQSKTAAGGAGAGAIMLDNMAEYRSAAGGATYAVGAQTVGGVLGIATLRDYNLDTIVTKMAPIRTKLDTLMGTGTGSEGPIANDAGNTGKGTVLKGGALVAFFGDANTRSFEIRFTGAKDYEVRYKVGAAAAYANDPGTGKEYVGKGNAGNDEVFGQAGAFMFKNFFNDAAGAFAAGDKFNFVGDPNSKMIEMPVLFHEHGGAGNRAWAFTVDHANSLVIDKNTIIVGTGSDGNAYGPVVDYKGKGATDIWMDYVTAAFGLAGYTNILTADSLAYHNNQGNVHCGTNVIRELPAYDWWDFK